MKVKSKKAIEDIKWKSYLHKMKKLEQDVNILNHPMVKKDVKEKVYGMLVVDFTEEAENTKIKEGLS